MSHQTYFQNKHVQRVQKIHWTCMNWHFNIRSSKIWDIINEVYVKTGHLESPCYILSIHLVLGVKITCLNIQQKTKAQSKGWISRNQVLTATVMPTTTYLQKKHSKAALILPWAQHATSAGTVLQVICSTHWASVRLKINTYAIFSLKIQMQTFKKRQKMFWS